jgi:hypothetical protein
MFIFFFLGLFYFGTSLQIVPQNCTSFTTQPENSLKHEIEIIGSIEIWITRNDSVIIESHNRVLSISHRPNDFVVTDGLTFSKFENCIDQSKDVNSLFFTEFTKENNKGLQIYWNGCFVTEIFFLLESNNVSDVKLWRD